MTQNIYPSPHTPSDKDSKDSLSNPPLSNAARKCIVIITGSVSGFLFAKLIKTFGRIVILVFGAGAALTVLGNILGYIKIDSTKFLEHLEPVVQVANNAHQKASKSGLYSSTWDFVKKTAKANVHMSLSFTAGMLFAFY
jgi:uncharacterized membrane protein (Fun14 family)